MWGGFYLTLLSIWTPFGLAYIYSNNEILNFSLTNHSTKALGGLAMKPLKHLGNVASCKKHMPRTRTLASLANTPMKMDITTRYKMPSSYDIPVLGYGVYQTCAALSLVTSKAIQH